MKLWTIAIISMIIFSGCNSRTQNLRLQNQNAKQALIIQQQQAQIAALNKRMVKKKKVSTRVKKNRSSTIPTPPKKNIKLKKVEDNNYSSGYMYPGQAKKKPQKPVKLVKAIPAVSSSSVSMGKSECVAMIGSDKFAKYTQMFGSEAASIKRCKMLKAMKQ